MKRNDIKEYKEILYKTVNPGFPLQNICDSPNAFVKINDFLVSHIPNRLFRYRRCIERNYDALNQDQVWVSCADTMNDGFDARLFFDIDNAVAALDNMFSENVAKVICSKIKEGTIPFDGIDQILKGMSSELQNIMKVPENLLEKDIKDKISIYRMMIHNAIPYLATIPQKALKFACFSENINSTVMWGQYADNETGFAVSYDFSGGVISSCQTCNSPSNGACLFPKTCTLYPVIYSPKRYKVSDEYVQYMLLSYMIRQVGYRTNNLQASQMLINMLHCPDSFEATKLAIHKSKEWEYEKEWRAFCTCADPSFNNSAHAHFPHIASAVYLGRKISTYNEKILKDIAKEKQLPVYKMTVNDKSPNYNLIPRSINSQRGPNGTSTKD